MHCERYHADVSVSTCLARRKKALSVGTNPRWGSARITNYDPGCVDCDLGAATAAKHPESFEAISTYTSHRKPRPKPAPIDKGETITAKTCKHCGKDKDPQEFYRVKNTKDGRDSMCKICRSKSNYEYKRKKAEAAQLRRLPSEMRPERLRDNPPGRERERERETSRWDASSKCNYR